MKPSHQTVLAFSASALVGLALRTRDCFAVDGAPRCLSSSKTGQVRHPFGNCSSLCRKRTNPRPRPNSLTCRRKRRRTHSLDAHFRTMLQAAAKTLLRLLHLSAAHRRIYSRRETIGWHPPPLHSASRATRANGIDTLATHTFHKMFVHASAVAASAQKPRAV